MYQFYGRPRDDIVGSSQQVDSEELNLCQALCKL